MKFRAWDKENNEMLYPDDTDKILFEINEYGITTYDVRYLDEYGSFAAELDSVVMQSTGLFDKNGTEIYEGDILKENSMLGIVKFGRYLDYEYIQFGLDGWLFSEKLKLGFVDTPLTEYVLDPHCSIEIIGNKFEHPHLLGED